MKTIVSRIEHAAKGSGQITFVTGKEPVTLSWGQLHEEAKATAASLQARGISHGDHVALLGPTTRDLVTSLQAVWLCGATLVVLPLPMRLASIEDFVVATKGRIHRADCAAVIVDADLAPFVEVSPEDPPVYNMADLMPGPGRPTADDFIRPDYHDDDLFVLQFTSGSTSEPKGVMLPEPRGGGQPRRHHRSRPRSTSTTTSWSRGSRSTTTWAWSASASCRCRPASTSCSAPPRTSSPRRPAGWNGSPTTGVPPPPDPTSPTSWPPGP